MTKDKNLVDLGDVPWQEAQDLGVNAFVYSLQPEMLSESVAIPVSNSRKGVKGNLICDRDFAAAKAEKLLEQLCLNDRGEIEAFFKKVTIRRLNALETMKVDVKEEIRDYLNKKLRQANLTLDDLNL